MPFAEAEGIGQQHQHSLGALQFIDDVLDFTSGSSELGKPNLNDIKSGVITAPVLFAAEEHPELNDMIQRKFKHDGDVSRANELVFHSNGIERTRQMAQEQCELAAQTVRNISSDQLQWSATHSLTV